MNQTGFLSAAILLAFFCIQWSLFVHQLQTQQRFAESFEQAVEIEQTNAKRTILETNLDSIIFHAVQDELRKTTDPFRLKQNALESVFESTQRLQASDETIQFQTASLNPQNYNIPPTNPRSVSVLDLETQWFIQPMTQSGLTIAVVENTGGLLQNQTLVVQLNSSRNTDYFLIPIHYQQTVTP